MARLRPKEGPARSRMLVKPRSRVLRASSAAARLMKPTSAVMRSIIESGAIIACQCASMRPGISVRPPPSSTSTPSRTGIAASSIAAILLPWTRTRLPVARPFDLPSNSLTLVKARGVRGASGMAADAALGQSAAAPAQAAVPASSARRENFLSTSAFSLANAGLWHRQAKAGGVSSSAGAQVNMSASPKPVARVRGGLAAGMGNLPLPAGAAAASAGAIHPARVKVRCVTPPGEEVASIR